MDQRNLWKTNSYRLSNRANLPDIPDEQFVTKLSQNHSLEYVSNSLMGTQKFVKIINSNPPDDLLIKILKLVAKLCGSPIVNNQNYIIRVTMQQKFIKRINTFLTVKQLDFWKNSEDILNNLVLILETALDILPMTMWKSVKSIIESIHNITWGLKNEGISSDCPKFNKEKFLKLYKEITKIEGIYNKPEIKNNNTEDEINEETQIIDNFRSIRLFPDKSELMIPGRQFLRSNIIDQPYVSIAQYLDIHFRLLREDFLNPIREDICDYLNNVRHRLFNVKIHHHVKFLERLILRDRRAFKIQFHAPQWLNDSIKRGDRLKRFMNGTLLIFSNDDFKTIICATIISSAELGSGRVLVDIPQEQPSPDYSKTYVMIECVLFFEPYHRVLTVLQTLGEKSLPMEEYILKINTEARRPRYMENVKDIAKIEGLNPSQDHAYQAAMTKEFVIIQGPPGTGKTFLGIKIVEEIIKLKEHWQSQGPILVICYTNHALDQFIAGLQDSTDKIARLGGKSNTTLRDLASKFGPEILLLDFLEEELKYERSYYEKHGVFCGVQCNPECDYLDYKNFIKMLKNKQLYRGNLFKHLAEKVPVGVKNWIEAKKVLGQTFFEIKTTERGIKRNHKKLHILETLRRTVIFKTDFLFGDNCDMYYFDDYELACWLLCDDGSIKSNLDTVESVGHTYRQKCEETNKIYGLLSDCIKESDLCDWKVQSILTIETLNEYAYGLEDYLKNYPNQRYLRDYLSFVNDKVDYFKTCLNRKFEPPDFDVTHFANPFSLSSIQRWQLYTHWIETKSKTMKRDLDVQMDSYEEEFFAISVLREEDNVRLLKQMDIVGMTTTCAAKMRSVLEGLKNPIVVVEEAAEVLESHIVAALTENCQHLILVGDHQQLRPTTSDYTIETKFNLGISLFERMVINNVQCHTLNVQHRMRPEISKLVRPTFYSNLKDSESVKCYPDVNGISKNIYFINHNHPEELYGDSSKINRHEAEFLIKLAVYLLKNSYEPEEITILAAYLGQTQILRQERDKCFHPHIKKIHITSVDNFQGEENKIILLSLVRSNLDNNIGFLAIDNRVCVALSRAREGFYIMGNMDVLCSATEMWKPIRTTLESQKSIGNSLPLCCRHHKDHVTQVSKPCDFVHVPEGGCDQICNKELYCKHSCKKKCHGYDLDHETYVCHEPCLKSICGNSEHKCKKICFEECGTCDYLIPKICPICHEKNLVPCLKYTDEIQCQNLVDSLSYPCLHYQAVPCYRTEDYECEVEEEHKLPCGHIQPIPCNNDKNKFKCQFEIEVKLPCGHTATRTCHINLKEVTCKLECGELLECGHSCTKKCHKVDDPGHKMYKCAQPCLKNKLSCNHPKDHPKCNLLCWQACELCTLEIISVGKNCSHLNRGQCNVEKGRKCYKRCNKKLSCGHNCRKQCYDQCGPCYQKTFKTIPECGHKIKVSCNETPMPSSCRKLCQKSLPCGHKCTKLCKDKCVESCNEKCNTILDCGHRCTKLCKEECTVCTQRCKKYLDCKHQCIKACNEECACKREKYRLCDHFQDLKCGESLKENCDSWQCSMGALKKILESMKVAFDNSNDK